jgi:hypothetical protein
VFFRASHAGIYHRQNDDVAVFLVPALDFTPAEVVAVLAIHPLVADGSGGVVLAVKLAAGAGDAELFIHGALAIAEMVVSNHPERKRCPKSGALTWADQRESRW